VDEKLVAIMDASFDSGMADTAISVKEQHSHDFGNCISQDRGKKIVWPMVRDDMTIKDVQYMYNDLK